MVNVAILGAGFMGKMHAECYQNLPNARIIAIGDIESEKASKLAMSCGARAFSNPEELIENKDVDLIDICLPTFLHKKYVIKAARAGKQVCVSLCPPPREPFPGWHARCPGRPESGIQG